VSNRESWIAEDPTCTYVLGEIHCREGNYVEAEALLRKSLQQDAQKPYTHLLLAQVLLSPIEETLTGHPTLPWRHPPDAVARMREAERAVTEAISLLEHYENRSRLHEALINRSAIRGRLNDLEGVLKDCDRVLVEDERNALALRNKGLVLLQRDQPTEAIACFEKIQPGDEWLAVALPLASAYMETGAPTKVVNLLTLLWSPNANDCRQIVVADLLLAAHAQLGHRSVVEDLLQVITDTWPQHGSLAPSV
jgi:tetratricopeptide (TPR) repeat protein